MVMPIDIRQLKRRQESSAKRIKPKEKQKIV